jgi:hypothetical protein
VDDLWPDEPDEPNPEDRWGNPERDLPRIPKAPRAPRSNLSGRNVPPEVARSFWAAVIFANAGLFGVSLGLMLIGFRGQWFWGGGLLVGGLLALLRTYLEYRSFVTRNDGDGDAEVDAAED